MRHDAQLTYSSGLLREAAALHWRQYFGAGFFVTVVALAVSLAFLLSRGDRSWLTGLLGAGVFAGLVFCALAFWVPYRAAAAKLKAMNEPRATLTAEESSVTLASSLGSSTLPWSAIVAILPGRSFWLIYFSKEQFVTVPLAGLSAEMQAFVVARVEAAGGKMRR